MFYNARSDYISDQRQLQFLNDAENSLYIMHNQQKVHFELDVVINLNTNNIIDKEVRK